MTDAFDIPILLFLQDVIRNDVLTPILKVITFFGDKGWFWIALVALLIIIRRTRPVGIAAGISLIASGVVNSLILKNLIARIRPFNYTDTVLPLVEKPDSFSFPSGHTCLSFAVALFLLRVDKRVGIPAVIFAAIIGFSRIYLGVHYPSDVIGGFLVALAVSSIVWLIWSRATESGRRISTFR